MSAMWRIPARKPLTVVTARKPRRAKQLGVTDDTYEGMLAEQGGVCAICGAPPKSRRLHVDHDHRTGAVRGLLCFHCNRALAGYVTEAWMADATRYLQAHDALQANAYLRRVQRG